jgi:uncharacterized protein (DUF1499 family)
MMWLGMSWWLGCAAGPSYEQGPLSPCPPTPNCVNSEEGTDPSHQTDPLPLGDPATARDRLLELVGSFPRTTILQATDTYVHVTFTTRWLRFTDDVEFRLDEDAGVVHLRSASRVGHGDLGVNRARVAEIHERWASLR